MRAAHIGALAFVAMLIASTQAGAQGWIRTKNIADDEIYDGHRITLYCGCDYTSNETSNGSGRITGLNECGFDGSSASFSNLAGQLEWEHIVPASLTPARQFSCWTQEGGGREHCEEVDPRAQAIIFDLHNLAPSIGQVNRLRSNDRYAGLPNNTSDFGACSIEDASGRFEPPDCIKGDVARVWFYMAEVYGVAIPQAELDMFSQWMIDDPVSPWEKEREERISRHSRVINPFVHFATPDPAGACDWE